jgi:hypothetical protein
MKILSVCFLGAITVLSSCGGGGGGGSTCSNAAACGGSIVGSWKITSSCVTVDTSSMVPDMDCPSATGMAEGFKVTGSVSYAADLTYTSNTTVSGTVVVTLPASCLMQQGITLSCAQLQQGLQAAATDAGFSSATCTGSSGCTCKLALAPQASTTSGTYTTTAAGLLTETETGGDASQSDYCVKGTALTVSPHTMAGMDGLSGTITLAKQ